MWDPPLTDGILGSLFYQLTVLNVNASRVVVNTTTTNTSYPLPTDLIQPCKQYLANVTAFSAEYQGDAAVSIQISPGGEPHC